MDQLTVEQVTVNASVHQPLMSMSKLFDGLRLRYSNKTCYLGSPMEARGYFGALEYDMPLGVNLAGPDRTSLSNPLGCSPPSSLEGRLISATMPMPSG